MDDRPWRECTALWVEESYGRGWQTLVHPEDLPQLLAGWRDVLTSRGPVTNTTQPQIAEMLIPAQRSVDNQLIIALAGTEDETHD
jgi:hypothetical protein